VLRNAYKPTSFPAVSSAVVPVRIAAAEATLMPLNVGSRCFYTAVVLWAMLTFLFYVRLRNNSVALTGSPYLALGLTVRSLGMWNFVRKPAAVVWSGCVML
jgi:hypothetical protein